MQSKSDRAFTLVEVVLAIGVTSFCCVILIGLLESGFSSVRWAIGASVQAQILQEISNNSELDTYNPAYSTNLYFDAQGSVASSTNWYYSALVSGQIAQLPALPTTYSVGVANATELHVAIYSKANPQTTNNWAILWCDTGN